VYIDAKCFAIAVFYFVSFLFFSFLLLQFVKFCFLSGFIFFFFFHRFDLHLMNMVKVSLTITFWEFQTSKVVDGEIRLCN